MQDLSTNDFRSLKARLPLLVEESRKRYEYAKQNLDHRDLLLLTKGEAPGALIATPWEYVICNSGADLDACLRLDNLLSRFIEGDTRLKEFRRARLTADPYTIVVPQSNFNIKRVLYEKQD